MLIDKKLHDLIEYLVELKHPVKITNIAKELNQNRRVIYYNLDKINNELMKKNEVKYKKIINVNNIGIIIDEYQKEFLKTFLANYDENMYFLNIEERQLLISILICSYPQKVIIEMLMDICLVSRNTIVSDLKDIKDRIESSDFNVSLAVNKKNGYFILGNDLDRVQYTYSLLIELYNYKNKKLRNKINSVMSKESNMFGTSFYISILGYLEKNIDILGKEISLLEKKKFVFSFPYIVLSFRKMNNGIELTDKNLIIKRLEYKFIEKVTTELNNLYNVEITKEENILLATILLCLKKDSDIHNNSADYEELKNNIEKMITIFENNAGVLFSNRENFIDRLITHFKSLLFRKKYNIVTANTLTETIFKNYKDVCLITKSSVKYIESYYGVKFSKTDIAYISLHFGSELINTRQKISNVKNVLIVSSEQFSIKSLIENQCNYYLPNCNILGVVDKENIADFDNVDFIITTTQLDTNIPYISVSPLITLEDITKIINFQQNIILNNEIDNKIELLVNEYIFDDKSKVEFLRKLKVLLNIK